jgi:hypothetical protein
LDNGERAGIFALSSPSCQNSQRGARAQGRRSPHAKRQGLARRSRS